MAKPLKNEAVAPVATPGKIPDLDRLIHERVRLGILSALAANEKMSFLELKQLLEATDGNVSVHARKLEEAGYIECQKSFEGRLTRTDFRITPVGRAALEKYVDHMESILRGMKR